MEYDLSLDPTDIWFSKDTFFTGEKVKIYARVHNNGSKDVTAYVIFYQGQTTIGEPQPISVVAGGVEDAVWVDWLAEKGKYNLMVRIVGQSPTDNNPDDDSITIPVDIDSDNEGDGVGDEEDLDDDNDGLSDVEEVKLETNSLNPDTDDDGMIDSEDAYPLDSTKSVKEKPKEESVLQNDESPAGTKLEFPNSLLGSRKSEQKEVAVERESRDKSGVLFFEFKSEENSGLKEGLKSTILSTAEERDIKENKKNGGKDSFNESYWLFIFLAIGWLIYFSPRIVKIIRRASRRGRRYK